MDINQIIQLLFQATSLLLKNDIDNLKRNINEVNISGRLSIYLQNLFPDYHVDIEFNGNIDYVTDKKYLEDLKDTLKEKYPHKKVLIRPDIIIHKRGVNDNNLVAIEVKKIQSNADLIEFDRIKLKEITKSLVHPENRYLLGCLLLLGTREIAGEYRMEFYTNGKWIYWSKPTPQN